MDKLTTDLYSRTHKKEKPSAKKFEIRLTYMNTKMVHAIDVVMPLQTETADVRGNLQVGWDILMRSIFDE